MRFFLLNAVGFFLQFLPPALIVFLPFPQETLRFRRGRIFAGVIFAAAALSAAFPAALCCLSDAVTTPVAANLFMLCAILLGLTVHVRLVREALLKKILVIYIVIFYEAVQYLLNYVLNPPSRPMPLYFTSYTSTMKR